MWIRKIENGSEECDDAQPFEQFRHDTGCIDLLRSVPEGTGRSGDPHSVIRLVAISTPTRPAAGAWTKATAQAISITPRSMKIRAPAHAPSDAR
jgi:hypothetical protein